MTRTFAAPPILVQLAKNPIVDELSIFPPCDSLPAERRHLSADTEALVRERIGCQINQVYGMTEIAPSHLGPDDAPAS